jgi:cold shock CspA family protein
MAYCAARQRVALGVRSPKAQHTNAAGWRIRLRGRPRRAAQIKALKPTADGGGGGFGFIRACERSADVFFHFSALAGCAPGELAVGDDVEFAVSREPPRGLVAPTCAAARGRTPGDRACARLCGHLRGVTATLCAVPANRASDKWGRARGSRAGPAARPGVHASWTAPVLAQEGAFW